MNRVPIIPQDWPARHNVPAEPDPPPPFGMPRQHRERECAGCGIIGRWGGGSWCPTCRADVPAPEPRSMSHAPSRDTYIAAMTWRLALISGECMAPDCHAQVEDPSLVLCVAHTPKGWR